MSSFRIDRQYVSFETAETVPVHAAKRVPAPESESQEKHESEIDVQKLKRDAEQKAEYIVSKAKNEAAAIIEKAGRQASEMVSEAQKNADAVRREAENTGLEKGKSLAEKRKVEEAKELKQLEEDLKSHYDDLVDNMRSEVVPLVMEIVRKIIGVKLSQSDEVFIKMVDEAVGNLKIKGQVLLRVSPKDYARYFGSLMDGKMESGGIQMTVAEDENFSEGDAVIETESEFLDLSIAKQIRLVERALSAGGE